MSVTFNTKKETTEVTCNVDGKTTFTIKGIVAKGKAYAEASKKGWKCKSADMLICPSCRETAKKPSPKTSKKVGGKTTVAVGRKPSKASTATNSGFGQSIGKVARTSKMSAAPAAE